MEKSSSVVLILVVLLFVEGLQPCFSKNSTFGCIEREREALLQLKESFNDSSNRLVSWTGSDCCQWKGVSCDQNSGHVVKLNLRAPGYSIIYDLGEKCDTCINISQPLSATKVSSCLVELKRLQYLDLSGNYFSQSPIPKFFGSLKHLRYLNLSSAGFNGKISIQLGNLTSLKMLDLSSHQDSYSALYVDNFQWASSLLSLQHLDMSWVNLSKALDMIEVLNTLPSLIGLRLSGCKIQNIHFPHGSLNSTFFARVQFLSLSDNSLTGSIPNAIQNMTALRELDLSNQWNRYSGELYVDTLQWASSLLSLQHLDMSGVNLSKALDLMQVLNMLPSLLELHLSGCGIQNIHFPRGFINSTFFASIQFLSLGDNALSGKIPDAVQNMTAVRALELSENYFNSTVPLWLVNSKSLVDLNLRRNEFESIEGGMLSMLNKACSLKSLDLSINSFLGEVLRSNKNSSRCLTYRLEHLDLSFSGVGGNLPNYFGQLKGLKELYLAENSLYGPIPSSIGELPALTILDLSENQLNGTVPQFSGRLSTLEQLRLSYNQLNGSIPQSLGRLSTLKLLDLSNNQLNGIIPQSLGRLSTLQQLKLRNNQLNGSIPPSLGKLSTLQLLDLSNNQLNGIIPQSLGRLSTLQYLHLSHNQLTGSVPNSLGQLVNLWELHISSNSLQGVVSELNFANLSQLSSLDISSNYLSCKFKYDWSPPFDNVYYINMSSCEIGSQFPHFIQNQRDVSVLDLSNANISGGFPILHRMSLSYLDLSMNKISGRLPTNIADKMPLLTTLLVSNNLINGQLPNSLCKMDYLEVMDLSRNKLSGEMPRCWRDTQRLYVINLSSNNLSGTIPTTIGHIPYLKRLYIDQNSLTGELPLSLRNFQGLEILDLGENKFSGYIPAWIGESPSALRILRLRNNMLNGSIPSQLCRLSELHFLDLANNNLTGTIPHCFGKLTAMAAEIALGPISKPPSAPSPLEESGNLPRPDDNDTYWRREKVREVTKGLDLEYTKIQLDILDMMDLSRNNLVGVIPEELYVLSGLRGLNLSHNRLSGNIPKKIGELKLLESLDLSNNNLCGSIPPSMSALPSISHLNLSHNNLSGKIPTSNQLQTLIDPSIYVGNLGLCGDPLPKCPGDDDSAKPPTSMAHEDEDHEEDMKEKILFYFVVLAGYATGLWGVIGTLVFKRNWRVAYFRFADNAKEWILVMVAVKVARVKQMIQRTNTEE